MEKRGTKILNEILEAVNFLKKNAATKQELAEVLETVNFIKENAASKEELLGVKQDLAGVEQGLETRLTSVESQMVTKEYLDEKLSDLRGDMTIITRKEDTKLKVLVEILSKRKVITSKDKQRVLNMEPFPSLSL